MTLINLLLRRLRTPQNYIWLDKQPVNMIDTIVFNDTIWYNITLGEMIEEKDVIQICKKSLIWNEIENMKNGFNTVISEYGENLSGGLILKIMFRYLIRNKKNSAKIILCVAFSVMLMFSLIQMGDILLEEFKKLTLNGLHRDFTITQVTPDEIEKIKGVVSSNVDAQMATIWVGDMEIVSKGSMASMLAMNGDFEYFKDCTMILGAKPTKENEIMISKSIFDLQPEEYQIENNIEWEIYDEKGEGHKAEFVICGVFSDFKGGEDLIFMTLEYGEKLLREWNMPLNSKNNSVVITVNKNEYSTEKIVDSILSIQSALYSSDSEEFKYFYKDKVLHNEEKAEVYSEEGEFTSVSTSLKTLTFIIAIGMVIFIYGAFHINIIRKIKQIGIMRCLGSDKKVLIIHVFGESIIIGHIGILLGMFCGNILNNFVAGRMLRYLMKIDYDVQIRQIWNTYAYTYVVALLPILLGTFKVWYDVQKISPVDAMNYEGNPSSKKFKTNKKHERDIVSYISRKNIWRNRAQTFTMISIVSVALILVLIITNTFFSIRFNQKKEKKDFCQYELMQEIGNETYFTKKDCVKLQNIDGIENLYTQYINRNVSVKTIEEKRSNLLVIYSDNLWKKLISYNDSLENIDDNKPLAIAYSSVDFNSFDSVSVQSMDYDSGKIIGEKKIPIIANCVGKQSLLGEITANDDTIKIILNEKMAESIGMISDCYSSICIEKNERFELSEIQDFIQDNFENVRINQLSVDSSDKNQLLAIMILASYLCTSFIILIIAIIGNMIELNLTTRKREYGIMRALGMDANGYTRVVCVEILQIEFYAILIALLLSIPMNFYFSYMVREEIVISIPAYLLSLLILTIVILLQTINLIKKNRKYSIAIMIQNKEV